MAHQQTLEMGQWRCGYAADPEDHDEDAIFWKTLGPRAQNSRQAKRLRVGRIKSRKTDTLKNEGVVHKNNAEPIRQKICTDPLGNDAPGSCASLYLAFLLSSPSSASSNILHS